MKSTGAPDRWTLAAFVFTGAAAYWFVAAGLFRQWAGDPNYTHGLFVIPLSCLLAWRRRRGVLALPAAASAWGTAVLAAAALLYLLGIVAAELFTLRLSMVAAIAGFALAFQGRERFRALWVPLAFLVLMVPLPYVFYYKATFPLQLLSSRLTASVLGSAGMPVLRSGNVIHLENYTLEVVNACSGLRSIMTLFTLAVFAGDYLRVGALGKAAFAAFAIPVAVAANTVRLVATALTAALSSPEAAEGFLHQISGVVVFAAGVVMLFAIAGGVEWVARRRYD